MMADARNGRRRWRSGRAAIAVCVLWCVGACDVWTPPLPTDEELDRGLVVMYPGSTNTTTELLEFDEGFRAAGIDCAIQIVKWALPMEHFFVPGYVESHRAWAASEAGRIAEYQDAHPGAPVRLLGFSGGSMAAIMVSEAMPPGHFVDRSVLMSPPVSSQYDLSGMLDHTREEVVVYWSSRDEFTPLLIEAYGTVDGVFSHPAATEGFAMSDPKLRQISWDPSMEAYGNAGDHLDYFWNAPWIRDYVALWLTNTPESN
jgi:hypothetical protein